MILGYYLPWSLINISVEWSREYVEGHMTQVHATAYEKMQKIEYLNQYLRR
jgi:hypothetical protein